MGRMKDSFTNRVPRRVKSKSAREKFIRTKDDQGASDEEKFNLKTSNNWLQKVGNEKRSQQKGEVIQPTDRRGMGSQAGPRRRGKKRKEHSILSAHGGAGCLTCTVKGKDRTIRLEGLNTLAAGRKGVSIEVSTPERFYHGP